MTRRSKDTHTPEGTWSLFLKPGLGVKRWLLAALTGILLTSFGLAILLYLFLNEGPLHWFTLGFLPEWLRGAVFMLAGGGLAILGAFRLHAIIVHQVWPELSTPERQQAVRAFLQRQQRRSGPRIVAIGGGTGMPQLLRGLRAYTDNITAIVTVADDGGSSGRLRRQTGMLPPGDFRNNIAALSEAEGLMTRLFQYRFAESDNGAGNELGGHSFGNIFITTMAAITGSFESGIAESSRVLAVRGRILPSTLENVTLCAEVRQAQPDGSMEWRIVEGESALPRAAGQIERVYLQPAHARAYPEAVRALLQADLIVAGPGSFFTSVLPNLLVDSIRDAICASSAVRIYVCNVATQAGETDGFSVVDHLRKLDEHAAGAFPVALANSNYDVSRPPSGNSDWVTLPPGDPPRAYRVFTDDVVDSERPWRHDSAKLAGAVMSAYETLRAEKAAAE
ncbi:MAG: YvcK family protein [Caldilinea sp.]|nr:YvcK family protein [Caldilinea sp.]